MQSFLPLSHDKVIITIAAADAAVDGVIVAADAADDHTTAVVDVCDEHPIFLTPTIFSGPH